MKLKLDISLLFRYLVMWSIQLLQFDFISQHVKKKKTKCKNNFLINKNA